MVWIIPLCDILPPALYYRTLRKTKKLCFIETILRVLATVNLPLFQRTLIRVGTAAFLCTSVADSGCSAPSSSPAG